MNARAALPWAGLGAVLVAVLAAHLLRLWGGASYVFWRETTLYGPTFALLGALILSRRPGNTIGGIFMAIGVFGALQFLWGQWATLGPEAVPGGPLAAWLSNRTQQLSVLFAVGLILLFPTGGLPGPRWRPVVGLAAVAPVAGFFASALMPGPLESFGATENPLGLEGAGPALALLERVSGWGALPLVGVALASQISRFLRSRGEERQQLKWFAYAATVGVLAIALGGEGEVIGNLVWTLGPLGLPVAATVAILRYRLYDIDRLIGQTLVYAVLSAILVGAYVGSVVLLQYLFRLLAGGESQLAVVASTLAIAALFNPLRRRVQAFVDRRFYRGRYDAARTLAAFGARLRDETDLAALREDLVGVIEQTVRPEHASLWLRGGVRAGGDG